MRPIDARKAKDRIEQIFCEDCVQGNKCMHCSLSKDAIIKRERKEGE